MRKGITSAQVKQGWLIRALFNDDAAAYMIGWLRIRWHEKDRKTSSRGLL